MTTTTEQEPQQNERERSERRLLRRSNNKVFAGVAGGIADYFGHDPVWIRLAFVVLAGAGGFVLYLVLWIVLPADEGAPSTGAERAAERIARGLRSTPSWVAAALVVIGGLIMVSQALRWRPGVVWGLGLVVVGILLFRRSEEQPREQAPAAPARATKGALVPPPPPAPPAPATSETPPPPPPAPRERSALGALTFGAVLAAIGIVWLLETGGAIDPSLTHYLALVLAIIGAGLVTGAWLGRARWLIAPGILVLPVLLTSTLIGVPLDGGIGGRFFRPEVITDVEPAYRMIAGRLTLDLRELPPAEPVEVEMTMGFGAIVVHVPPGRPVEVRAHTGAGVIELFGEELGGYDLEMVRSVGRRARAAPIVLDLETSLGTVNVYRWEVPA